MCQIIDASHKTAKHFILMKNVMVILYNFEIKQKGVERIFHWLSWSVSACLLLSCQIDVMSGFISTVLNMLY